LSNLIDLIQLKMGINQINKVTNKQKTKELYTMAEVQNPQAQIDEIVNFEFKEDLIKFYDKGQLAAGKRVRARLSLLISKAKEIKKQTLEMAKEMKAAKKNQAPAAETKA
jgi:geranylgeranyl pyrophosphate synthase